MGKAYVVELFCTYTGSMMIFGQKDISDLLKSKSSNETLPNIAC